MENTGWLGLYNTIKQRWFQSWETTLIGALIALGDVGLQWLLDQNFPPAVHTAVGIISMAFAFYKKQGIGAAPKTPPATVVPLSLLLIGCLFLGSSCAHYTPASTKEERIATVDCAAVSVVSTLVSQAVGALLGGGEMDLAKVVTSAGPCVVPLARKELANLYTQSLIPHGGGATALLDDGPRIQPYQYKAALDRADKWLAAHPELK